jgi:hypothetical protein
MRGQQGKEIAAEAKKYNFRLLVDDAHGFGTLGKTDGAGKRVKMILMFLQLLQNRWLTLVLCSS